MKTIEEFEREVEEAVKEAQQEGWTITKGGFLSVFYKTCCPLGAICLKRKLVNFQNEDFDLTPIEHEYGKRNVDTFWMGFDSRPDHNPVDGYDTPYFYLGRALAKELKVEEV